MAKATRYFGAHVSASGGLEKAIENGAALGVNTIQIHPSPPQRWNSKPFAKGVEDKMIEARKSSCVQKIFFHGVYLINLATPDDQKFHLAKLSLVHDLDLLARISGEGLIFHVGSAKDQPDEKTAFKRVAEGVNWVLDHAKNEARLILEVAAGSGSIIGDRMEELAEIYDQIENKDRVGFGLDTQHMWASGYNFQTDIEKIVEQIDSNFGLKKVWSVHLNDSMTDFASKKDRHANIGEGKIGKEALQKFLNHPKLVDIPFILETPALKSLETARAEVERVKALLS